MRETIIGKQFDEERALYHLQHTDVENCIFAGPLDGESALKESRDIGLQKCQFSLRYPLWHVKGFTMADSKMEQMSIENVPYKEITIETQEDACLFIRTVEPDMVEYVVAKEVEEISGSEIKKCYFN